jgi:hypothetical protein
VFLVCDWLSEIEDEHQAAFHTTKTSKTACIENTTAAKTCRMHSLPTVTIFQLNSETQLFSHRIWFLVIVPRPDLEQTTDCVRQVYNIIIEVQLSVLVPTLSASAKRFECRIHEKFKLCILLLATVFSFDFRSVSAVVGRLL